MSLLPFIQTALCIVVIKAVEIQKRLDIKHLQTIKEGFQVDDTTLVVVDSVKATSATKAEEIRSGARDANTGDSPVISEVHKLVQYYQGIPIYGCGAILEVDSFGNKTITEANIAVRIAENLRYTGRRIPAEEAMNIAKSLEETARSAGKRNATLMSKDSIHEDDGAPTTNITDASPPQPEAKLVIIIRKFGRLLVATLVYHVTWLEDTDDLLSKPNYLLDAMKGNEILHWNGLDLAYMESNGGNEKIGEYRYGRGRWKARRLDVKERFQYCSLENSRAKLIHCYHGVSCYPSSSAYRVNCYHGTSDGSSGAYSQAADAFWFTTGVFDMMRFWFGDYVITNSYSPMCVRVHYRYLFSNAFWDGRCITFGDGDGSLYGRFLPLAVADVVAHELGHAYTDATSNLIYWSESGGMNEAFSDMIGETFKAYLRGETDWLLGHDMMKSSMALRYMKHPPLDGRSIQCQRDFHSYMGVHSSSGIYNKAFYLLATTPGWNIQKAFRVFQYANRFAWHEQSTFNSGACGVQWAARIWGYNEEDVKTAFAAVGVFCECPSGFVRLSSPEIKYSCYRFHRDIGSWAEAKTYCESIGARLVTIRNNNEFSAITRYLGATVGRRWNALRWTHQKMQNADFWVAGSDLQMENLHHWTYSGDTVKVRWHSGQPDDDGRGYENCLSLQRRVISSRGRADPFDYALIDDSCYLKKFYICELTCSEERARRHY